jgi:DNA-binding SARP family transcriptional activator/tetratricopeptide (TPR) repeat protein
VRFGILGPLQVTDSGREVVISAGRDRTVLAMLLLKPGRIVSTDDLIDAVWEDRPPATARGQLQTCVSRLRRTLRPGVILTDPAGYGISVTGDDLDAVAFTRLVAHAKSTAADARESLQQALALWRGAVLAGIDSRPVRHQAAVLEEQRATAIEDWVDIELADGRDRDLVAELTGLVERFPLRERLRAQLMLALYRTGRQADALAEYRHGRDLLREQVGVEPGPELQDLHRQILLGGVEASQPRRAGLAPVDMLPRAVRDFTGHEEALGRLLAAVNRRDDAPQVQVIDGMAGSGKTTIAVHLAGLLREDFPDAQLFIDLYGHSERRPSSPAAALMTLLRQLGVPANRIPDDDEERVQLWRTEIATRRALVVLDNAASTAQVSPLLPTSGKVLVLVTSRRRLAGLDAVRPESLGVLSEDAAVALLTRIVGDRVGAEPQAAIEVVRRCGYLPLAIRLAGARLAHRPRWRIADLAHRLAASPLPELAVEHRTVAHTLALSYGQLPERAQRLFRLLALHPAERFGAPAVAALAELPIDDAQDDLDELVDVHLVEEPETGHYRLHDLVREYAGTLSGQIEPAERRAAVTALVDLHLHATAALCRDKESWNAHRDYPAVPPLRPELVALAAAHPQWLDRQRGDLARLVQAAAEIGDPLRAWQLARVSWVYLYMRAHIADLTEVLSLGCRIAREAGDERGAAAVGAYLASGYYRAGRHEEALRLLGDVLRYERGVGDRVAEARCLANRAGVLLRTGRVREALTEMELAYDLATRLGQAGGLNARLVNVAMIKFALGRHAEATREARIGLQYAIELRDDRRVSNALTLLAQIRREEGRPALANRLLRASLRLASSAGHRVGEWECHNELGRVALAEGRYPDAVEHHLFALRLMREHGDAAYIAAASNDLAAALLAMGDPIGARELRRHALSLARQAQVDLEQGRALAGLADCTVDDDPAAAGRLWRQALDIFTRMQIPARFAVEARLAALGRSAGAAAAGNNREYAAVVPAPRAAGS